MSEHTLRSLFDLIASNRKVREENTRAMEQVSPAERPRWNMQIAVLDQDYRAKLNAIDELSGFLAHANRLQEGWPYPAEDAVQVFRAELAHRSHRSVEEIDQLPLRDVVALLGGSPPSQNGPQPVEQPAEKEITGAAIAALPRWARTAFAARCVRRLVSMLPELTPPFPPDELLEIERAVQLAEQSAAKAETQAGTNETAREVMERAKLVSSTAVPESGRAGTVSPRVIALLRGTVGSAAATAARAAVDTNPALAFDAYKMAATAAYILSSTILREGMRRDFLFLESRSKGLSWTDRMPIPPTALPQPRLRLMGLHIRGLRAVRQLDLPQDGLGWQGRVPDLILLAGINGSGKTTLLNFLTDALALIAKPNLEDYDAVLPKWLAAQEAWADFELESYEIPCTSLRFIVGDQAFVNAHLTDNCWWIMRPLNQGGFFGRKGNVPDWLGGTINKWFQPLTIPSVVFLPSEDRTLIVPGESYKAAGKLVDAQRFVHRWRPPAAWKDSLEALLYSLPWEDLNAKEEAPFTQTSHFSAYADAFRRFTEESKYLKFEEGRLVVKIEGSAVSHDLAELSSGEKQVLLLGGELLRHWRPGSLVLIDEPELHLHSTWQTKLYEALRYWQAERGGQVILATQSSHLFHIAEPGTAVLLGVDAL